MFVNEYLGNEAKDDDKIVEKLSIPMLRPTAERWSYIVRFLIAAVSHFFCELKQLRN